MANDDAWQAGLDLQQNRHKKKQEKKQGSPTSSGGNPWSILTYLPKKHKGGRIKKTGGYLLKKGEYVLTAAQAKQHGFKGGKRKSSGHKRVSGKG